MSPPKCLIYTLLVGRPETYLPMFACMWRSLAAFADSGDGIRTDFLVIGNRPCLQAMAKDRQLAASRPKFLRRLYAHEVPVEDDLHDALLRKLDIVDFRPVAAYDHVMYMDCDIIVQTPFDDIFRQASQRPGLLHAPPEYEDFNHLFFGFERYSPTEIGDMRKLARDRQLGNLPFNDGTFIFRPDAQMLGHFAALREFARSSPVLRRKYYDQSFLNDYFNRRGLASTTVLEERVVIFPKEGRLYMDPRITFVHFAGLQGYADKARRMRLYLRGLLRARGWAPTGRRRA